MTVKCLKNYTQECIVARFKGGDTIGILVYSYGVSRRTIIRVLEDHGVDPKIHRRPGRSKPKPVLAEQMPLNSFKDSQGQEYDQKGVPLSVPMAIFIHTPWYRRVGQAVRRFFTSA